VTFYIFCSDAPIACPVFNLVQNSFVQYGNVSTCFLCSFWMSMWYAMPLLAITLVLSTLVQHVTTDYHCHL